MSKRNSESRGGVGYKESGAPAGALVKEYTVPTPCGTVVKVTCDSNGLFIAEVPDVLRPVTESGVLSAWRLADLLGVLDEKSKSVALLGKTVKKRKVIHYRIGTPPQLSTQSNTGVNLNISAVVYWEHAYMSKTRGWQYSYTLPGSVLQSENGGNGLNLTAEEKMSGQLDGRVVNFQIHRTYVQSERGEQLSPLVGYTPKTAAFFNGLADLIEKLKSQLHDVAYGEGFEQRIIEAAEKMGSEGFHIEAGGHHEEGI